MRVLLLTHNYEPEVGAPQQRWGSLVQRFRDAGHEVHVIAPPPHFPSGHLTDRTGTMRVGSVHPGLHGETVYRCRFRPYGAGVGSRGIDQAVSAADTTQVAVRRFRGHRPDVVIATAPALPTLGAGALVARALGAPLVTEMRDAWPDLLAVADEWKDGVTPSPRSRLAATVRPQLIRWAGLATRAVQRRSAAVVATTESFADAVRARGIEQVHVIRNGAHPVPHYPRHVLREPDGELRVLYLGTIGRAQGLGSAILAARRAHGHGARIRLRIVGGGAEFDAVRHMAEVGDVNIEVLPHVSKDLVHEHYAWADTLLVHLRPWSALSLAVPSKLYEAMSLSMHITGALSGEAAQIVQETESGTIVAPGDPDALAQAWTRLARNPARLAIGATGRLWTQTHTNDDVLAAEFLALLESVAAANPGVGRRA